MADLREIRANRIGLTFLNPLRRDPFHFVPDRLLMWILYSLTRPVAKATHARLSAALKALPAPAAAPAGPRSPTMVWPKRRYEE